MFRKEREYWQAQVEKAQDELQKTHDAYLSRIADIEDKHRIERETLLERIQRPEIARVPVNPNYEDATPPEDFADLSLVGKEVPDGYEVGRFRGGDFQDELDKVGTVVTDEPVAA